MNTTQCELHCETIPKLSTHLQRGCAYHRKQYRCIIGYRNIEERVRIITASDGYRRPCLDVVIGNLSKVNTERILFTE